MLAAGAANIPNAIASALDKAGQQIRDTAQALAPVKTGRLRSSISYEANEMSVTVTAGVFYARFQEYGTRYIRPHAFMRPALSLSISQIQSDIAEAVAQAFED